MKKLLPVIVTIAMMITIPLKAKDYIYSEHFPVLPQPWYIGVPEAMDIGPNRNLYIADGNRISIFSSDGVLLWHQTYYLHSFDTDYPRYFDAIAVGPTGTMYVGDVNEGSLLKINPQGKIMSKIFSFRHNDDLDIDNSGNIYYLWALANSNDPSGNTDYVYKLDPDGHVILSFGKPTSSDGGDLSAPSEIRLDSHGKVYVSSLGDVKMKIYDSDGHYLSSIDFTNYGYDVYSGVPYNFGLATNYIMAEGKNEMMKIDYSGNLITRFQNPDIDPGIFWNMTDIIIIQDEVYISNPGRNRVEIFSSNGDFITNWQSWGHNPCEFWRPNRIDVDHAQNVYVCDTGNNRIQVFDRNWNLKMIIGSEGPGPGEFDDPTGVAVDDEGNIYVADKGNFRVQKFNKRGEFVLEWGSEGTAGSQFLSMNDIAIDRDGYVYVLDDDKETVKKFTNSGQFLMEIGNDLYLTFSRAIAVDDTGTIYITTTNSKVKLFTTDGAFITEWSLPYVVAAYGVAVSHDGKIMFTDSVHNQILYYDRDGHLLGRFGNGGDPVKNLHGAGAITVNDQGRVYILDGGSRVLVYRPTPGAPKTIPAAASTVGANGTHWQTDVTFFNPGNETINLDLSYLQSQSQTTQTITLDPLESLTLPDVIANLFNSPSTFGAITSTNLESTQPLILSRTYNQTDEGTFGQGIRASPYEATFYQGETAYLTGLKRDDHFRTNVGFVNLVDIPIEITLTLHDESGDTIGEITITLPARGHSQVNAIFDALGDTGDHTGAWAEVTTATQAGRFTTYASIVDNLSGDPVYIEGEGLGERSPDDFTMVLPVAVCAPGAYGATWKTEIVLTNVFLESMEVTLTYHPADGSGPYTQELNLAPGEVLAYDDLLTDLFSLSDTFGNLEILATATGLKVRSRITTGQEASYGQGIAARRVKECEAGITPLYLLNLKENATFRSNAGFVNLSDEEILLTLDLIADGAVVVSKTQFIPARSLVQVNAILPLFFGVTGEDYILRITGPEGAIYTAYLSTVDNRTGDSVFQDSLKSP